MSHFITSTAVLIAFLLTSTSLAARSQETPPAAKQKTVVDLTHVLEAGLPNFHIDPQAFQYKMLFTIAKNGFADGEFKMPEHYGTHMDAPSHFIEGAQSIEKIDVNRLIVPCVVIDARAEAGKDQDYRLSVEKLKEFENDGVIPAECVVLLMTGWEDKWAQPEKYRGTDGKGQMHFPGFSAEAVRYLADERHVTAVGIDTLSLDYGQSKDFPVHKIGLGKNLYFLENLTNLDKLPRRGAQLFVGPLTIKDGTGSQARVLAQIP